MRYTPLATDAHGGLGPREHLMLLRKAITLFWREVAGVTELTRLLNREGFLWCESQKVKQQALSQIFLTFPAVLFERFFKELLAHLRNRWSLKSSPP
jgi:hypothetical protein